MMLLNAVIAEASIGGNLATALTSEKLWVNIAQTVIFILLGFFFTKKKLLPDKTGKILTKFVMSVCLPCLAFCSFMSDFTVSGGIDALVNFILGFGRPWSSKWFKVGKDKPWSRNRDRLWRLLYVGFDNTKHCR